MKTCPVTGCDVPIHDAEVVCRGCLASVSRQVRSTFVSTWHTFSRTFRADDQAAYERAVRTLITDAGQRKRPATLPLDDT